MTDTSIVTRTLHSDPGHGWLEVSRIEVHTLRLLDAISGYSYQSNDGATLYLEEDCDMSRYFDAMEAEGYTLKLNHLHHDDDRIRGLQSYRA